MSQPSRSWCARRAALVVAAIAIFYSEGTPRAQGGGSPCGPSINVIVCENLKTGNPASEWDISGAGDTTIQGFTTDISANRSGNVQFKVKTDATNYRLDIYRMGYYGGLGARKVATVLPSATLPQTQPACLTQSATGLIDCGNWAVSASWPVPSDAVSGIYFARAVRPDTGGASHIFFVVRDDSGQSDLLFQTSDTTWQAYNAYGGNSLYTGAPVGRAYKVSYNRPMITRSDAGGGQQSFVFNAEYPMVRWLEANGYHVSYTTGVDTDRRGAELLEHKVFLSVGHDEYWSAAQRSNVENARNAGVNLAFFSGNDVFWKTRWETSIDGSGTAYRTLVSYKETHANAKIDPTTTWTGTWRDPRFSPDGGRPENALTGTLFMVNGVRHDEMTVPASFAAMRFWRNTSVATLAPGETATFGDGILGYEWNEDVDNGFRPAGLLRLSSTTVDVTPLYLLDHGSNYGAGMATHSLTLYRAASGALVFSAGTVQYAWGLDSTHDRVGPAADVRLQQATVNLFADMRVQPGSLQAGLVSASASLDVTPPTSTITAPAAGATLQSGTAVTVTGTAADAGGGTVAGVEVSTDGGTTWNRATGGASWSYVWTPGGPGSAPGTATLRSRAVDDSSNMETPGPGRTVTLLPLGGLVAGYGMNEGSGTVAGDVSGSARNGTVTGAAWTGGRFGGGLSFDGADDWVTVADAAALDLTTGMTLEAWVNPTNLAGWRSVIIKEAALPAGLVYSIYANDDIPRPATTIRVPAGDRSAAGTQSIPVGSWTHLAGTYDGARLRLYVNGLEVSNQPVSGAMANSASPVRIGGNSVWGEHFAGLIDEVRIYNRPLSRSEIQSDMVTPVGGEAIPDTVPPTVSVTAPVAGAVLNGVTTVTVNASDNVGIVGVQFLLDGAPLGSEDLTIPYSISWDTRTAADGTHQLSARARDAAANTGVASPVGVTTFNTTDTTLPTVTITAPAAGATVSGVTTISATASDNIGVAAVTFFVDGVQVGGEDTTAPYEVSWNTTAVTNGPRSLTATARDLAGNLRTSSPVSVTVANTAITGLVAAYGFDEGTGTTTADMSGGGRNGTLTSTTWTTAGKNGNALSFNGTTSWVTVADANALDLTTAVTLEAWVNPTTLTGWRTVIIKESPSALAYSLYANDNSPWPAATINTGGIDRSVPGTAQIPLNTWTHLAMTYDGAALRLYVNGVQAGVLNMTGSMITTTSPLRIGGNAPWGERFAGIIDDVRVYNRALTATEISQDMNRPVTGGDAIPPTVSSVTPANGATTGPTVNVTATFSESMDPATVDGTRVQLRASDSTLVPAAVTYDAASKTATLDPSASLALGGVYTATITGGTGGVKDLAGNALVSNFTWSFSIANDGTPPVLTNRSPTPAAVNVASTAHITATFDEPIDATTYGFVLRNQAGALVATTRTYDAATRTARLVPTAPLASATAYTAALDRVTDVYGNAMTPTTWSFTTGSAGFVETVVFSGLIEPTTIQFAPDGRVFVAEKRGVVKVFDNLTDQTPDVFADFRTKVHNYWDRGLLGLALHPSFPTQPYVYVLYTHDAAVGGTAPRWGQPNVDSDDCPTPPGPNGDGCVVSARLSRLTAAGNVMTGTEQVLIENWGQQYPSHSIGTLLFGPDGALYASAGDGASFTFVDYGQDGNPVNPLGDPPVPVGGVQSPPTAEGGALRSQDLRTSADPAGLSGTVLRLNPDTGAAMTGNPLIGNADLNARRVIAYGLRNPFRFTFKPGTSQIFVGDVGWQATEEVNRITDPVDAVVENFGWPCYEGNVRQSGYESAGLNICANLYAQPSAVTMPIFTYAHGTLLAGETCSTGSSSTSGLVFYANGNYPAQYRDALFLGDYSRGCIWVMFKGANGQPDPSTITPFRSGAAGPVDLKTGPGGDLFYVDLGGGTIRRFQYFDGNSPPVAVIAASPTSGTAPLTVTFNGSGSTDPNPGDPITFAWDLDNDGQFDDGTGATAGFTYSTAGVFTARLRVTDSGGLTDTKSVTITTSGAPPVATIHAPAATLTWSVGQVIAFSGSATDPEDGTLAPSALSWQLNMHHCPVVNNCHIHPLQQFSGVASGSFAAPDHDYPSFVELILTATDSSGQTNQKSVRLDPQTTVLQFNTSPSGLSLAVGSTSEATPFTRTVIVGSNNSISAPATGTLGASSYEFVSWSDAGAATHNVTAPAGGASYVATYSPVPSMSINSVSVNEAAGGATATFTASLSTASSFTVTASYATSDGTATAGTDYVAKTGTLTFAPGVTTAPVTVTVNDDALDELNETFLVTLSNPTHAAIVGGPGTGTIADNDPEPTMTIDDALITEGNTGVTMATFVIRLSTASGRAVTGSFGTANGTATAGSDYTATAGPFSIAAGSTTLAVQVPVVGDVTQESDETFVLNLTGVSGAVVADAQATGTIQNDDVPGAGGLIAAYGFEESTGSTTADATGKGHTGTVTGTDWADDGKNGRGLWFPTGNNWVTIADANDLDLTNGMTIEAWVNPFGLGGWNTILMKEGTGSQFGYSLYANDNSPWPAVTVQIANVDRSAVGTTALPLNTWSHVAATYDGTTLRLYVNGVQVGSRAQTGTLRTTTGPLRLGGNDLWGEFFHGIMDDVRIYNRALTQTEIQTDMNSPVQ